MPFLADFQDPDQGAPGRCVECPSGRQPNVLLSRCVRCEVRPQRKAGFLGLKQCLFFSETVPFLAVQEGTIATGHGTCDPCGVLEHSNHDYTACVPCGNDTTTTGCTCPDGFQETTQGVSGRSCEQCPAGRAGTHAQCVGCAAGRQPAAGRAACENCPLGRSGTGGVCDPTRVVCPAGQEPQANHTQCADCLPGKYSPDVDTMCQHCAPGEEPDGSNGTSAQCRHCQHTNTRSPLPLRRLPEFGGSGQLTVFGNG